ncbi:MAG: DUF2905 domain-containing protein [Actinomycetota bacterium]|nr:DUF2905 domain-containing protein [Actinomycetota bacterium]MDI6821427.1 DUF2905 domain-containing protein [Actinomycetota bacterium]
MDLQSLGKIILLFGLILFITGGLLYFFGKGLGLQRFPGDILYRRGNFTFYFPLGACILISIVLTILLNLLFLLMRH